MIYLSVEDVINVSAYVYTYIECDCVRVYASMMSSCLQKYAPVCFMAVVVQSSITSFVK